MTPRTEPGPSALPRVHGIAKCLPNGSDVGTQPVGADQQRTVRGTAAHPLDQLPDQGHVTLLADLAAQPQTCLDHDGECHPHDTALFLDAQLIGLHLPQVPWLLDQILVHGLALTARAGPPTRYGALVEPKRRHNRLYGAPMGEQGHHDDHSLTRGAQPIENRARGGTDGFVTLVADAALLLL